MILSLDALNKCIDEIKESPIPEQYNIDVDMVNSFQNSSLVWRLSLELSKIMTDKITVIPPDNILECIDRILHTEGFNCIVYFLYFLYMRNAVLEEPIKDLLSRMRCI